LPVNLVKVVSVSFRFISTNLKNFGNKSRPRPALDLNDDIQRVRDVRLDYSVWHLDATLQDTSREARDALSRRIGVDGTKSPAVTGVQKLQKVEGFGATNFAEDDSVGPVS